MTDSDPIHDQFPGSDAECFIQWKGTDLCMDLRCRCGHTGHVDAPFAYHVRCPQCRQVYRMGTQVKLIAVDEMEADVEYLGGIIEADY